MKLETVKAAIETTPKGSNVILEWIRPCKTRKGVADSITKQVRMVGRIGIEYDNIGAVQDKRESGELPAENAGLPWGVWSVYPYLIEHKGNYYVRLYNGTSDKVKPQVQFFRNNQPVEKSDIEAVLLASELTSEKGNCFTAKVENVTRIHREEEWMEETEQVKVAAQVEVEEPVEV